MADVRPRMAIVITDTGSLTADDAANIVKQLLSVLGQYTLAVTYSSATVSIAVT